MHPYIFITGQHVAQPVCIVWSWACQRGPTWGWSARRILLPYSLLPPSGDSVLYLLVFLTRCIPSTLAFRQKLKDFAPFLRVTLSIFNVRYFSGGGSRVVGVFSLTVNFRARCWVFPSAWSYWRSMLLSPVFSSVSCLSQKVPCFLGAQKFSEGLIRACKRFPGKSSPFLVVLLFSDEEGLLGYLPFSLTVLLGVNINSSFCRKGDNLIDSIEEIVSTLLQFLYFLLTFSHSDFENWCTR